MRYSNIGIASLLCLASSVFAQQPTIHKGLGSDDEGLFIEFNSEKWYEYEIENSYHYSAALGSPVGTENGVSLDFGSALAEGSIYVGLIPYGDSKHPHPVFRRRLELDSLGRVSINLKRFRGVYDMVSWEENGFGTVGYRLMAKEGQLVFDGKVHFTGTGPFVVAPTVIHGPYVNQITDVSAMIAVELSQSATATLSYTAGNGNMQSLSLTGTSLEFKLKNLKPNTVYDYTLTVGKHTESYQIRTAPSPGARLAFTFAYASDSRSGQGGGERDMWGANAYIMKKIMALATQQNTRFFQFSGDLINGYLTDPDEMRLQYANWKNAIGPWWNQLPLYISMGNHEALMRAFINPAGNRAIWLDRWPYATESGEAVFRDMVYNPSNGPKSEDGASYDPNLEAMDFPPYDETVFSYTYDNVGVIVLNSDYFYSPTLGGHMATGGGLHAYIMDQQVAWLKDQVATMEGNDAIDHVFVTQHTPFFPNGGHVRDDMWYSGNNEMRTAVNGELLEKGIIERRDEMLNLLVNESTKVRAILTGDEHNYAKTEIGPETIIHPEGYEPQKVALNRTIWQINNGAAGAPYYAQETTPWTPWVSGFTTQHALVLFDVEGKRLKMRVLNPDTLEEVDQLTLVE